MKKTLGVLAILLGISLAALAVASLRPADPALSEFLVGIGYLGLMLAPVSALALLAVGGIALVRLARADATATANRAAVERRGVALEKRT